MPKFKIRLTMVKFSQRALIVIFSLTIVFHILVLVSVIPFDMIWGGRIKTLDEMYVFEAVSLSLNLVFLMVILIHSRIWFIKFPQKLIQFLLWVMVVVFMLNTVGNLLSKSTTETMIFTPLTILITIFCLIILLRKQNAD